MDFQLKTLDSSQAATEKADVLIVLVPEGTLAGQDPLSTLVSAARQAGDLPDKAGKLLSLYRPAGVTAARVVLAPVGDGTAASVRSAVLAACGALKGVGAKRLTVLFAGAADE